MPVLPIIVIAQLFGTSLWFSANAAGDDLMRAWQLVPADLGRLTNAVQLGFILGTLGFSLTGRADRFPASRIFAMSYQLGLLARGGELAALAERFKAPDRTTRQLLKVFLGNYLAAAIMMPTGAWRSAAVKRRSRWIFSSSWVTSRDTPIARNARPVVGSRSHTWPRSSSHRMRPSEPTAILGKTSPSASQVIKRAFSKTGMEHPPFLRR